MNVWIVEDESHLAQGLRMALEKRGYAVETAESLASFQRLLDAGSPEIVLLDIRLPDGDGLTAIPHILKSSDEARIIVMTAFGDSSIVVRAIKQGAYNYLDKPFPLEAAMNMIARASEAIALARRVNRMERRSSVTLAGSSPEMRRVEDFVRKVAPYRDVNILVRGESGSGKEVVARLIHVASGDRGEFVPLNCAAIPESLLETELFGCLRGAFTGATSDRTGLAEIAHEGTLFLDEIGGMPLPLQGKLLRFLDSRSFRPIGGGQERKVSLRVICATCDDLDAKIAERTFRSDLYYRISMLPLELPPLRSRGEDVIELAHVFIDAFRKRSGGRSVSLTPEVRETFLRYPWPGNVRELKNIIERIFILRDDAGGDIALRDLPGDMLDALPREESDFPHGGSLPETLQEYERRMLEEALARSDGKRGRAARELGISRFALLRRMQRLGMEQGNGTA